MGPASREPLGLCPCFPAWSPSLQSPQHHLPSSSEGLITSCWLQLWPRAHGPDPLPATWICGHAWTPCSPTPTLPPLCNCLVGPFSFWKTPCLLWTAIEPGWQVALGNVTLEMQTVTELSLHKFTCSHATSCHPMCLCDQLLIVKFMRGTASEGKPVGRLQ